MNELERVITDYEHGLIDYDQAQVRIFQLTGKIVEQYQLDSYWGAESLESFMNRLLTGPITDWQLRCLVDVNGPAVIALPHQKIPTVGVPTALAICKGPVSLLPPGLRPPKEP